MRRPSRRRRKPAPVRVRGGCEVDGLGVWVGPENACKLGFWTAGGSSCRLPGAPNPPSAATFAFWEAVAPIPPRLHPPLPTCHLLDRPGGGELQPAGRSAPRTRQQHQTARHGPRREVALHPPEQGRAEPGRVRRACSGGRGTAARRRGPGSMRCLCSAPAPLPAPSQICVQLPTPANAGTWRTLTSASSTCQSPSLRCVCSAA